jgi:hypothetical protein
VRQGYLNYPSATMAIARTLLLYVLDDRGYHYLDVLGLSSIVRFGRLLPVAKVFNRPAATSHEMHSMLERTRL